MHAKSSIFLTRHKSRDWLEEGEFFYKTKTKTLTKQ